MVVPCRYASLFNSYVGLLSAAEDSRPLLLIGMQLLTAVHLQNLLVLMGCSFSFDKYDNVQMLNALTYITLLRAPCLLHAGAVAVTGMGARGMGPLRAALEWTPVQAHATANPVTLYYITQSQQSAAYLADWDQWRNAGVSDE